MAVANSGALSISLVAQDNHLVIGHVGVSPVPISDDAAQGVSHAIQHRFCPTCGIHPFAEGELHGQKVVAVNVRCLEGIDLESLHVKHFDGRAL